ncbi:MAG: hypothetical protein JWM63_2707 [Gammaproteobacteria bacterium]|jgi:hypothetical protein|nr:hypothetical protein [Gammaproteobacteria bacterium]
MIRANALAALAFAALALSGCGGSTSDSGTGSVHLSLTDARVDGATDGAWTHSG